MRSFILAGGRASRAFPFSLVQEKSMLRLGGKPIVRIIVDRILKTTFPTAGGEVVNLFNPYEMVMCILGEHLDDFQWEFRDVKDVKFSPKMDAIGTVSHYFYGAELEQHVGPDEWVLMHYADCLTEIDYAEFVRYAIASGKDACIAVTANATHDYSEVVIDNTGTVSLINEKPKLAAPTWTGIACFKHGVIKNIMGDILFGRKVDFAFDVFPKLVAAKNLSGYVYPGFWADTGNAISYMKLKEKFGRGDLFI